MTEHLPHDCHITYDETKGWWSFDLFTPNGNDAFSQHLYGTFQTARDDALRAYRDWCLTDPSALMRTMFDDEINEI